MAVMLGSGAVYAQSSSVTLYGTADMGMEFLTNAKGTNNNLVRVQSGNLSGSNFGLMGVEDLGGGVKAVFRLEAGFDLASGTSSQGGRLFGRQAFAGLSSNAGSVTLGRQYSSIYDVTNKYDPMSYANYSLSTHDAGMMSRADKSIKYTGNFDNLMITGFYSFGRDVNGGLAGDQPGNSKSGRQWGLGMNYAQGPFGFGLAYDALNTITASDIGVLSVAPGNGNGFVVADSGSTAKRISAVGSYSVGPVQTFLGYRNLKTNFSASNGAVVSAATYRSNLYWGGATWQVAPELALTGAVYHSQNKDAPNVTSYVLSSDYFLSKRTDVYTNMSYIKNRTKNGIGSNWGVNTGETVTAGKSQFGVQVGLRHKF
ncbi:MAG: porin [Ottowia sp.]|nr:porin [Ottowia sp.]